jgi:hypothetical protein
MLSVFLLFDIDRIVGIPGLACFSVGAALVGHSLVQEKKGCPETKIEEG